MTKVLVKAEIQDWKTDLVIPRDQLYPTHSILPAWGLRALLSPSTCGRSHSAPAPARWRGGCWRTQAACLLGGVLLGGRAAVLLFVLEIPAASPRRQPAVPRLQLLGWSQTMAGQPGSTARQPRRTPPALALGGLGRGQRGPPSPDYGSGAMAGARMEASLSGSQDPGLTDRGKGWHRANVSGKPSKIDPRALFHLRVSRKSHFLDLFLFEGLHQEALGGERHAVLGKDSRFPCVLVRF